MGSFEDLHAHNEEPVSEVKSLAVIGMTAEGRVPVSLIWKHPIPLTSKRHCFRALFRGVMQLRVGGSLGISETTLAWLVLTSRQVHLTQTDLVSGRGGRLL